MTDAPVSLPSLGLTVPVPAGWQVIPPAREHDPASREHDPASVQAAGAEPWPVVLAPRHWSPDDGFQPTLTLAATPADPSYSPHRAGMDALARAMEEEGSHIVGYDQWPSGRRLTWLTSADGSPVVVQQWVLARAARVVTLTAAVDVTQWIETAGLLDEVVRNVSWTDAPAPEPDRPARGLSGGGGEPRRDSDLAALGIDAEDLSHVSTRQRFRPAGATLDREGVVALLGAEPVPGAQPPAKTPRDLVRAGLATPEGATREGMRLRTIVQEADRVIEVEGVVGPLRLRFSLYGRGAEAVVLCSDGVSQWVGKAPRRRALSETSARSHVVEIPTAQAVPMLASWLGVGPAWSLGTNPRQMSEELVVQRVQDRGTPPPSGADAQLKQVWARVGALWTVTAHDLRTRGSWSLAAADAHDRGAYQLTSAGDGLLTVEALPGPSLLAHLVRMVLHPIVSNESSAD